MIIMASASGTPASAIARLVAADEYTVRDVVHLFNQMGLAALTKVIAAFNDQIKVLEQQVSESFRGHRSAVIYLSQPGWDRSWAPGYWASSATTRTAMPPPKAARTTPQPARSPGPPGRKPWRWPATPATSGSPTRSTSGHFAC